MPATVRSTKWFVRVTVPHSIAKSEIGKILEWRTPFGEEVVTILAATHVGDKTEKEHFHMVMQLTSNLQKQTIDTRIKKIYGVKCADYSSKPWDGNDSACSYLFHDPSAEIIINKGHSDEDINRYRKLNDDVQKVIAVNKSRAPGRHVDRCLERIEQSGGRWTSLQIFNYFIKRVHDGEMYYPGDYQLKKYIEEVLIRQCVEMDELDAYIQQKHYVLFNS